MEQVPSGMTTTHFPGKILQQPEKVIQSANKQVRFMNSFPSNEDSQNPGTSALPSSDLQYSNELMTTNQFKYREDQPYSFDNFSDSRQQQTMPLGSNPLTKSSFQSSVVTPKSRDQPRTTQKKEGKVTTSRSNAQSKKTH